MTTAGSSRAVAAPGAGARARTARTLPTATAVLSASFNVMSSAKIDDESCHRLAPAGERREVRLPIEDDPVRFSVRGSRGIPEEGRGLGGLVLLRDEDRAAPFPPRGATCVLVDLDPIRRDVRASLFDRRRSFRRAGQEPGPAVGEVDDAVGAAASAVARDVDVAFELQRLKTSAGANEALAFRALRVSAVRAEPHVAVRARRGGAAGREVEVDRAGRNLAVRLLHRRRFPDEVQGAHVAGRLEEERRLVRGVRARWPARDGGRRASRAPTPYARAHSSGFPSGENRRSRRSQAS